MPSSARVAPRVVIASRSDAARPIDFASSAPVDALAPIDHRADVGASAAPHVSGRFARDARLVTPAAFDRGMRKPAIHRSGSFALHLAWTASDPVAGAPQWRLGLVIPKRYEASAVARNTIKRRWRDAFRRGRGAWAAEFGSADVVVRLQAPLVPKPPKAAGRGAPRAPVTPLPPARVRARDRFDPVAIFGGLVDRLRSRGGRPTAMTS